MGKSIGVQSARSRDFALVPRRAQKEVVVLCDAGPAVGVPPWPFPASLGPARSVGRLPLDGSRWRVEGPTKWGEGLRNTGAEKSSSLELSEKVDVPARSAGIAEGDSETQK